MQSQLQPAPFWWKSELSDIEEAKNWIKKGKVTTLGQSAGGREICLFEYGRRDAYARTANYSSALGCKNLKAYKDNQKPHIFILGEVHGAEWDGIVSSLNLMRIFETGCDFMGNAYPNLATLPERAHIAVIPAANPDGRARVKYRTVVGMDRISFRKEDQGVWNDGTYCEWPDVKKIHPIRQSVTKLGGYFNDDGVNLMHDSFTNPMAEETKILMRTAEALAPDIILNMHGHGAIGGGHLIPSPHQATREYNNCFELSIRYAENMLKKGYPCEPIRPIGDRLSVAAFNLDDALNATCGAMVVTYESDQGVILNPDDELRLENRHEKIYEKHMIFYETVDNFMQELYQQ